MIDGDTLEIRGQRIRLHGIDAPESGQSCEDEHGKSYRCGQRATLALADLIGRDTITCWQTDIDQRYGRIVAVCHLGGLDLNAWMVGAGHALAWRKYSWDYVAAETLARRDRKGIWAGRFVDPWDWRRGVRLQKGTRYRPAPETGKSAPTQKKATANKPDYNIKANISRSGARIYHVPGQEYFSTSRNQRHGMRLYPRSNDSERQRKQSHSNREVLNAATRISPGKGEQWFCSEAEARAAGWRRAKR